MTLHVNMINTTSSDAKASIVARLFPRVAIRVRSGDETISIVTRTPHTLCHMITTQSMYQHTGFLMIEEDVLRRKTLGSVISFACHKDC